ncbi:MAG: hypothetical protein U9R28_09845 [Pseudomonadota bacterium]|nr:hypothetical protein [Pseudomonadota bacterium]
MLKRNYIGLLGLSFIVGAGVVQAQNVKPPYPNYPNAQPYPNSKMQSGPAKWMNQMQDRFIGRSAQDGGTNIFQDAKGFYKMMGNGKTRYKFYFDVDFQIEMDAWMKSRNRANQQIRHNQNQQHWNHQGQVAPGYQYRGQGYYQGYVYPQPVIPNYYGRPAPQR